MKIVAREILWFIGAVIVGIPTGFLFLYMIQFEPAGPDLTQQERNLQIYLYGIGVVLGILGVYLIRLIHWGLVQLSIVEA